MHHLRRWSHCSVVLAIILFCAQETKTQTETVNAEFKLEVTTDHDLHQTFPYTDKKEKSILRQPETQNKSLDDVTISDDVTEVPNVKVVDSKENKKPESASRVIVPITNFTINDINNKEKSKPVQAPTRHAVERLEDDELRAAIKKTSTTKKPRIQYDKMTGKLLDTDHPCKRECKEGEEPLICYYHFKIEWYHAMSKACYYCPYNATDCLRPDCIPADGVSRPLLVVNRQMPGPQVEVCQNDRVIVDVENDMMTEGTSVHWHGQHQKNTPFMDGTPYISQCPILPETSFRYQFNAVQSGTHFWHSHSGLQRADGLAGAFIVKRPRSQDPHSRLYDYDRSEHVMIVTDWIHVLSVDMFTDHHHSSGDNKPPTLLINGAGRFKIFDNATHTSKPIYMKSARFNVEQGYKYRFRVINAEFLNCPIEMSVDGHNITVINSDGFDLEPITATSLVTYAGERYDFIIDADNEIDNYWIRFRGLMDCDERFTKAKQVAVLHYEGAMDLEPPGDPTWEELHNNGLQLNALNKGEEEDETVSVAEMQSLAGYDDSLKEHADYQFYVAYDFYLKNNSHFHKSPYYGYYQATSLVTYAGERYDFIIDADNEIDNYWIRFRGLMDCDERFTKAKQVAVLHYEGAMDLEPPGDPTWEELHNNGLQLNALNKGEEEDETVSVAEMQSLAGYDDSLKEHADYQFYVAYDFYLKNNSHFHKSPYYGYYQVPEQNDRLTTPQLNHISMKFPSSPLMITRPSPDNFCNSSSIERSCKEGYCECSHVLSVHLNSVVEVIIVDEGVTFDANHPFHLHGHNFRVVGMRRLSDRTTIEEVKAFDEAGFLTRNLKNAPLKDTVTVPDGGYTVIRFKADNPGYWLFHCHLEFHVEVGMALVFKVGEHREMKPVPRDFPTCGSYMPDNNLEQDTTVKPSDNPFIQITHWWPVVVVNHTSSSASTSYVSRILIFSTVWLLRFIIGT